MYLVGGAHPHKVDARRLLEELIGGDRRLVTDAEVFQEILHRYFAIRRLDAVEPAFEVLKGVVDEVFPIAMADVNRAREILGSIAEISARDALHAAIMERNGIEEILTFDRGFDAIPGVSRLS